MCVWCARVVGVLDGAVSAASVAAEFTGHIGGRVDRVQWQQDKAGRSGSRGVVKRGCSTRGEHNTHWQTVEWEKWASALTPIEPDILQGHHNEIGHDGDKTRKEERQG